MKYRQVVGVDNLANFDSVIHRYNALTQKEGEKDSCYHPALLRGKSKIFRST